jgi:hypothetical protein
MAKTFYSVHGAGTKEVNGVYEKNGTLSYVKGTIVLSAVFDGEAGSYYWTIIGTRTEYYQNNVLATPPLTGWSSVLGDNLPVPVLTTFITSSVGEKELKTSWDELTASDATKAVGHIQNLIPEEKSLVEARYNGGL